MISYNQCTLVGQFKKVFIKDSKLDPCLRFILKVDDQEIIIQVRNKLMDVVKEFIKKGDKILCQGKIKSYRFKYNDSQGSTIEIDCDRIKFLHGKKI